jgi:drug/metabolite transporter (DMT)-like permease
MLLITCIVIIILYPQEFTSKHFVKSLLDYNVILIGVFTAIGMLLYYWLLTKMDLYMVSLIWIVIILLVLIISFMYFKENINMIQWFGIALAIIGLSLIFIYKNN